MKTHLGIMTNNTANGNFNLSVYRNEKREGFFIIHPVGAINTNTSPILQNEVEQIFESKPEIIVFDMKQVDYINFRGLRVILKTILEMDQRYGKVYLTNLQPQIREIFEIMNGALPEWIFESRKQLGNHLDAMHDSNSDSSYRTKFEAGIGKYNGRAEVKVKQGI